MALSYWNAAPCDPGEINPTNSVRIYNFHLIGFVIKLQHSVKIRLVATCHLTCSQLVETTCSKPVDNKFWQSTCNKAVDNLGTDFFNTLSTTSCYKSYELILISACSYKICCKMLTDFLQFAVFPHFEFKKLVWKQLVNAFGTPELEYWQMGLGLAPSCPPSVPLSNTSHKVAVRGAFGRKP